MEKREGDVRLARRLFAGMGLCLLAYAAAIAWLGHVTVSGKHSPPTLYTGTQALLWAASYACFGIGLLGVLLRKPVLIGVWLGLWLVGGILMILLPIYL